MIIVVISFSLFFLLLQQVGREDGAGVDYSCEGEEDFFFAVQNPDL